MTPNNTSEQKKRVIEIFNALLRRGMIRRNQDFFTPIGISAPLGSTILQPDHKAKFPKSRIQNLFDHWKVNPDFYYYSKGPMFQEDSEYSSDEADPSNRDVTLDSNNIVKSDNINYHIAGSGRLLKAIPGVGTKNISNLKAIERDVIPIPILEKRAQAGYALGHADPEYLEYLPKIYVSKEFEKGNYVAFEVEGDSMDDNSRRSICDGEVLLAREVERDVWREKLNFGRYLFVIVYEEGCVFKQITNHDTETGEITCHSFNLFYEDFNINLKNVYKLYYVHKIVERPIRL